MRHRPPIFIHHAPRHDNALTHGLAAMLRGQIGVTGTHALMAKERTGHFRQ
jgi:hypothetical protein